MRSYKMAFVLACMGLAGLAGCSEDSVGLVLKCTPGVTKCENNTLSICLATAWQDMSCPAGCNAAGTDCAIPEGVECVVTQCKDDSTLAVCTDGKLSLQKCPNGCQGFACTEAPVTECEAGAKKCSEDGKGVAVCGEDGKWGSVTACEGDLVCDPVTAECKGGEVVTECEAGAKKCSEDGKGVAVCGEDGAWGDAVACEGDLVCDPLSKECKDAGSVAECAPGAKQCAVESNGVVVCGEDGKWGSVTACEGDLVCDPATAECKNGEVTPECEAGAKKCSDDGKASIVCGEDGVWGEPSTCDIGMACDAASGECKAVVEPLCAKGELKCSDDHQNLLVCNEAGDGWAEEKKCDRDQKCLVVEGVAQCVKADCVPGQTQCADDIYLQTCDANGKWAKSLCPDTAGKCAVIDDVAQCVQCAPGSQQCVDDSNIKYCGDDGKWSEIEACPSNGKCDTKQNVCTCNNGGYNCTASGDFQVCENRVYKTVEQCGSKEACSTSIDAGKNVYPGCVCTPKIGDKAAETRCNEDKSGIQICELRTLSYYNQYTRWVDGESCDGGACMMGEDKVAYCSCTENDVRCSEQTGGASIDYCYLGKWLSTSTCKTSTDPRNPLYCSETVGACVSQCSNVNIPILGTVAETKCSGRHLMTCENGIFVEKECEYGCEETGYGSVSYAKCRDASLDCKGMDRNRGVCHEDGKGYDLCRESKVTTVTCKDSEVCVTSATVVNKENVSCATKMCENGAYSCTDDGKSVRQCVNNAYQIVGSCPDKTVCDKGICVLAIK